MSYRLNTSTGETSFDGDLTIATPDTAGPGDAHDIFIEGGDHTSTGQGGAIFILAGDTIGPASGAGSITIQGGFNAGSGGAGSVSLVGGASPNLAGHVEIKPGAGSPDGQINLRDAADARAIEIRTGPQLGFFGATPIAKPTIAGSRGGNAALADLLTKLASFGLIVDSTTA